MAWLKKRGNVWFACWLTSEGKEVRKSTRVHVKPEARDGAMNARELKKLAERVADGMEASSKEGLTVELAVAAVRAAAVGADVRGETVGEFAKRWMASRRHTRDQNNMKTAVESLFRLQKGVEELPLHKFTTAMAEDFMRACLDEVSGGTTSRRLGALVTMFNRAVKERLIDVNPVSGVRPPKWSLNEANEREPFTREELQLLLEKAPGEWPDMVAVCLLLGGQRLGDLAQLKWAAVDFERGLVTLSTRKTNRGMTKPLILPLRKILERRRTVGGGWSEFVFPYAQIRYAQAKDKTTKLSIEFGNIVKELGIAETVKKEKRAGKVRGFNPKTFHSLRTTATTFLLDVGCPAELVRHIVGHDSPEIERAHYYKPQSEVQQNYMTKLAEILGLEREE